MKSKPRGSDGFLRSGEIIWYVEVKPLPPSGPLREVLCNSSSHQHRLGTRGLSGLHGALLMLPVSPALLQYHSVLPSLGAK